MLNLQILITFLASANSFIHEDFYTRNWTSVAAFSLQEYGYYVSPCAVFNFKLIDENFHCTCNKTKVLMPLVDYSNGQLDHDYIVPTRVVSNEKKAAVAVKIPCDCGKYGLRIVSIWENNNYLVNYVLFSEQAYKEDDDFLMYINAYEMKPFKEFEQFWNSLKILEKKQTDYICLDYRSKKN